MLNYTEEFLIRASLRDPLDIGATPLGVRQYFEVKGGQITGDRIEADILGGGEWALICPDGYLRVDVRLQARTNDGAALYIQYGGLLEMNEKVQRALSTRKSTSFDDQHFYINPRIESGSSKYSWLNTTFFIGEGRITEDLGVEYRIYSVSSPAET